MLPALIARDLTKSFAGRTVLDGVELVAAPGRRLAVIGENGVGKSTLLRLLAGRDRPDSGLVQAPAELGYLAQEPAFADGATVASAMAAALAPLHRAVRELEQLSSALATDPAATDRYPQVLEWAQAHQAWDADRRAELAMHRLGLAGLAADRPVEQLSGGQRSRLAMALLMTSRPDCVLLDEPTNHLDDAAVELLEQFLLSLPGVVVLASHDRVLIERVGTDLLDLDPVAGEPAGRQGIRFGGRYSDYLRHKAADRERWQQRYAEQQRELTRLRVAASQHAGSIAHDRGPRDADKFIYQFKGAKVDRALARRVRDAQRRLQVAEREQLPKPRPPLHFDRPLTANSTGRATIAIRDLRVAGRLSLANLTLPSGARLLVTGENGSGKSSLLAVLAGRLAPDHGRVEVAARTIGLLPQLVDFAAAHLTAQQTFDQHFGPEPEVELAEFGLLHPRELNRPVGALSVGQQRRLALAILVARAPELLLLDEPTNHISLALADELAEAVGRSAGTVVIASHDRWLRERWSGQRLVLPQPSGQLPGAPGQLSQPALRAWTDAP
ncbi:MAG: ABC-F family ATP-binding cassette domain-containing protein [Jatrophihabitantaceae bacterium]